MKLQSYLLAYRAITWGEPDDEKLLDAKNEQMFCRCHKDISWLMIPIISYILLSEMFVLSI